MGLGSTAKRVSKVADLAEELYGRVQELRKEVAATRETVTDTNERVDTLERELAEQRAIVEALAAEQGVDPAAVVEGVTEDEDQGRDATEDEGQDADGETADGGAERQGATE